jgi:hypothetical protein
MIFMEILQMLNNTEVGSIVYQNDQEDIGHKNISSNYSKNHFIRLFLMFALQILSWEFVSVIACCPTAHTYCGLGRETCTLYIQQGRQQQHLPPDKNRTIRTIIS